RCVLEAYELLLGLKVREQTEIDFGRRQAESGCRVRKDRVAVKAGGTAPSLLCEAENRFAQLLRRLAGHHLKIAAVFEELGQSLVNELPRVAAKGFFEVGFQPAARAALLAAKQFQQPARRLQPYRIGRI